MKVWQGGKKSGLLAILSMDADRLTLQFIDVILTKYIVFLMYIQQLLTTKEWDISGTRKKEKGDDR